MNTEQITQQSKAAYGQWAPQWREHCKIHSKFKMKPMTDFENVGVGKAVLCVANGYSFEENIETIKKHKDNVDILACDKTLGHLLNHGIKPTYVVVCDANVDYETYLAPWKDQLKDTICFINVCGNPKWTEGIEWKDLYFFINKDVLSSEKEFSGLSGCNNFIPAGTNVSNAMVILLTQSDNEGRRNFFGYDKILLIGYDYSWRHGGKYYAFNETGDSKSDYMCHNYLVNQAGSFAYTSGNLAFSAQWLIGYQKTFRLPLVQCSKETILSDMPFGDLATQMQYNFRREDAPDVKKKVKRLRELMAEKHQIEKQLATIGKSHWLSHVATV